MKKITDYEILDHGVEHSQYFQGCGVAYTEYDFCVTGTGYSQREALENALNMLPDMGYEVSADLERELTRASDTDAVTTLFKDHNPNVYRLTFVCYNGMHIPHGEHETMDDAQNYAKSLLDDWEDRDFNITCLEENDKDEPIAWEVESPSNANGTAVTDEDGHLEIESIEPELPEDSELYYHVSIRIKGE